MKFLIIVVCFIGLALAQNPHQGHGSLPMKSMGELERLRGKDFDIAFMSMMIDHHQGAIEMAQEVLKRSKDSRVRQAAQSIVVTQGQEIAQLTAWLKTWYGVTPSQRYIQMMRSDIQAMMDTALKGIQNPRGNPDKAFLEGMIPHHQDALTMSKPALSQASKAELRGFAQAVINSQSKEIANFQAWLRTLR